MIRFGTRSCRREERKKNKKGENTDKEEKNDSKTNTMKVDQGEKLEAKLLPFGNTLLMLLCPCVCVCVCVGVIRTDDSQALLSCVAIGRPA
jgi:hypothetical protein